MAQTDAYSHLPGKLVAALCAPLVQLLAFLLIVVGIAQPMFDGLGWVAAGLILGAFGCAASVASLIYATWALMRSELKAHRGAVVIAILGNALPLAAIATIVSTAR